MDPKPPSKSSVHPMLLQAVGEMRDRRYESALLSLKKIIRDQPGNEVALGMLASAYAELGMRERARQRFDELLKVNPRNPLARFQRGMMDFEEGSLDSALDIWQPLLADKNDFMGHFHSALALIQLERPDEVRDLLATARERMPPNHPLASEATRLMDSLEKTAS